MIKTDIEFCLESLPGVYMDFLKKIALYYWKYWISKYEDYNGGPIWDEELGYHPKNEI